MTTNDSRSPEAVHDETVIENLLTEAGMNDPADAELVTPALLSIRALVRGPQPTPRGELAALLTGANTDTTAAQGSETISSLQAHRTKRHARLAIAAAALSLSLGAGAAAAVASPDFRQTIQNTVSTLIQALAPSGSANRPGTPEPGAPAPMAPSPPTVRPVKPDLPAQTTPSPARPETSGSLPHPEPTPEFNTPPGGPNPTRPAPEIPAPAPAPPAQPDTPAPAHPRPDTIPVPSPPAPATASGNQAPPHPARP